MSSTEGVLFALALFTTVLFVMVSLPLGVLIAAGWTVVLFMARHNS